MAGALFWIGAIPNYLAAALGFILFNTLAAMAGRSARAQPGDRRAVLARCNLGYLDPWLALGWASMALLGSIIIGVIHFGGLMVLSALSGCCRGADLRLCAHPVDPQACACAGV